MGNVEQRSKEQEKKVGEMVRQVEIYRTMLNEEKYGREKDREDRERFWEERVEEILSQIEEIEGIIVRKNNQVEEVKS